MKNAVKRVSESFQTPTRKKMVNSAVKLYTAVLLMLVAGCVGVSLGIDKGKTSIYDVVEQEAFEKGEHEQSLIAKKAFYENVVLPQQSVRVDSGFVIPVDFLLKRNENFIVDCAFRTGEETFVPASCFRNENNPESVDIGYYRTLLPENGEILRRGGNNFYCSVRGFGTFQYGTREQCEVLFRIANASKLSQLGYEVENIRI